MARRPNTKTIERVFKWLDDQGLSVYGPNVDLDKRILYPACMDYTAQDAIRYSRLKNKLTEGDY